uniref:Zinc finger double-stranded RNA binding domain-containing protein n=1 Tax=Oncorhynchus mykiss TaxID=8022 RepID=A0A8C7RKM3_ONCMY
MSRIILHNGIHTTCSTLKLKLNLLTDAKATKKNGAGADQKTAAKAALVHTCLVCRVWYADPNTFKQHFESKHPKSPMVPVLVDVQ